jgi:serine/threonine protein kinase HipA of HipAB toxin-antitoxin module
VINAASKCASVDLDVVAAEYHRQPIDCMSDPETAIDELFRDLKRRLTLLRRSSDLLEAANDDA